MKATVEAAQVGLRLDVFVTGLLPALSRASVQKLCDDGRVLVNDKPVKISRKLKQGDAVTVNYDSATMQTVPEIDLPILYEDDDCVVINKPLGLLTHSKGSFNPEATVATWLQAYTGKTGAGNRDGIVHRLDRATSGVMICAKHAEALSWLQKQFSQRKTKKTYMAIVSGQPEPAEAIIDMPIERNPKAPATFRVGANGKPSVTHYRTVQASRQYALLELKPTTGRTHQLRVHLQQRGHPIIGDVIYSPVQAERLFLHAVQLELTLPNRQRKVFEATLPAEFQEKMNAGA